MRKAIKEIVVTKKIKDLNLSLNNLKKYATLQDQQNLCIKESTVKDLILKNNQVYGVITQDDKQILAHSVVAIMSYCKDTDLYLADLATCRSFFFCYGSKPSMYAKSETSHFAI